MYLIVGCGFLGGYVMNELHARTGETMVCTRRTASAADGLPFVRSVVCDVTKPEDLDRLMAVCGTDRLTVFYFAAMHNVDRLYEHPQEGRRTNIDALSAFLDRFDSRIDRFLFSSTDCVYGEQGDRPPFAETDAPRPVNEYGRQKLEAEDVVRSHGLTVLRFPFMLGPSLNERPHFYDKIVTALKNGEPVEMIDGMVRSVLSYADAARLAVSLALYDGALPDTVNVCGDRGYGKYDVGRIVARNIGADPELVVPLTKEEGRKFFKDVRADAAVMDDRLIKKILGLDRIVWEEDRCS